MNYNGPSATPHDSGIAVAMIVARNGKVLLMKRTGSSTGNGHWAVPGGGVEFNEDPMEAASRELKEETGLIAKDFELLGYSNDIHKKESLHYIALTLFANNPIGKPKIMEPNKCSDIGWFSVDKLPEPMYQPTLLKVSPEMVKKRIRESK